MSEKYLDRWEPFRDMLNLRADMDRLFKTFFTGFPDEGEGIWAPVVDIEEDKDNILVKAEIPGLKKDEIRVTVRDNMLSISGERKQKQEIKDRVFHRIERSYGKFSRRISLPVAVDADKIKANYKDGILHITLPKPESVKPKQIEVEIK
jgi:HSP20 family protein